MTTVLISGSLIFVFIVLPLVAYILEDDDYDNSH